MTNRKFKVDLSLVTIRRFVEFVDSFNKDNGFQEMIRFCDEVIVGGMMNCHLDEIDIAISAVSKEIAKKMDLITAAIEMGKLLGDIEKHLEVGGDNE